MADIFQLLDALERAEYNLATAKFVDNWQRSQIIENSARADIRYLTDQIRRADLFAKEPLE